MKISAATLAATEITSYSYRIQMVRIWISSIARQDMLTRQTGGQHM